MASNENPVNELDKAYQQFGESIKSTLVTKTKRRFSMRAGEEFELSNLNPPAINPSPIAESAFKLGFAAAKEGDRFSFLDRQDLGKSVVSGVAMVQDEMGMLANRAFAEAKGFIGDAESKIRAANHNLAWWIMPLIIMATIIIDSVAAHSALSIIWNANELFTWTAAVAIALLLAITGWILAITGVNLLRKAALWIGLVLTVASVLTVGWTAAELRGIQQSRESAQIEVANLRESLALIGEGSSTSVEETELLIENVQQDIRDLSSRFDTYVLFFYAGLILFTVSVASLAKAYEAFQQSQTYDRRTTKRQLERGQQLALAESALETLESWIPAAQAVEDLGTMAVSRYGDGFRSGLSPEQLDVFSTNPPKMAEMTEAKWIEEFKRKIDSLRELLKQYRGEDFSSEDFKLEPTN